MWMICVILMVFHLPILLLNFVIETQQQGRNINITHRTTTFSQARYLLAAISSGELVFFGGGKTITGAK
jgi:hypothetical protein